MHLETATKLPSNSFMYLRTLNYGNGVIRLHELPGQRYISAYNAALYKCHDSSKTRLSFNASAV